MDRKDTKKCYIQYSRFSCQRKTLKHSPFEELESLLAAWFQQAGGSGTLLGGRAIHNTTRLGMGRF
jgi:hypothetical protein